MAEVFRQKQKEEAQLKNLPPVLESKVVMEPYTQEIKVLSPKKIVSPPKSP